MFCLQGIQFVFPMGNHHRTTTDAPVPRLSRILGTGKSFSTLPLNEATTVSRFLCMEFLDVRPKGKKAKSGRYGPGPYGLFCKRILLSNANTIC